MNFVEQEQPTEAIKILISNTVLGSNGARYRHVNALEKLTKLDNPLYFSLMAKELCLGNIALCQREDSLYLRYFTFHPRFQATLNASKRIKDRESILKEEINVYLNSLISQTKQSIYAYIEPDNIRSLNMAKAFGFSPTAKIAMYHFSRRFPRASRQFKILTFDEAIPFIRKQFSNHSYYVENPKSGIYAGWLINNEIAFVTRLHEGCWEIKSMKGAFGKLLINLIPWVPILNKIITPNCHKFLAFDSFLVLNPSIDTNELNAFLSAGLAHFNVRHMMHWVDESAASSNYLHGVRWGILDKIIGKSEISLMVKGHAKSGPYFIDAMDML
jgi:hypothetical protein